MGRSIKVFDPALTIAAADMPDSAHGPWWSAEDGVGGLAAAAVKASLDCSTLAAHHFDSVIEAVATGPDGNAITLQLIGDSAAGQGVSITEAVPNAVVVHYESGVSTVGQVEAAIAALTGGLKIVEVKTHGTLATVLNAPGDNFAATALANGTDEVGSGHQTQGWHVDEVIIYVNVSAWGALTQVELVVERNTKPDGSGRWGIVEPSPMEGTVIGRFVDTEATGQIIIKDTLPVGQDLAIPVRIPGARRFRFGFRAADANDPSDFAATAAVEYLQDSLQG